MSRVAIYFIHMQAKNVDQGKKIIQHFDFFRDETRNFIFDYHSIAKNGDLDKNCRSLTFQLFIHVHIHRKDAVIFSFNTRSAHKGG